MFLSSLREVQDVALLGASCAALALSCGGQVVPTDANGGATSGVSSSISSSATSTITAAAGGGDTPLGVTIEDSPQFITIDCRPGATSDPVDVNFDIVLVNPPGQSPGSVTFPAASITFTKGTRTLTWNFSVTPSDSGMIPSGPPVTEMMSKVVYSGYGIGLGDPCVYCGTQAEFDLRVQDPGLDFPRSVFGASTVGCEM